MYISSSVLYLICFSTLPYPMPSLSTFFLVFLFYFSYVSSLSGLSLVFVPQSSYLHGLCAPTYFTMFDSLCISFRSLFELLLYSSSSSMPPNVLFTILLSRTSRFGWTSFLNTQDFTCKCYCIGRIVVVYAYFCFLIYSSLFPSSFWRRHFDLY